MTPDLNRRDFLKTTVATSLSAPLLATALAAQNRAIRPLVISSANNHLGADGQFLNGGINCVAKAMEILKAGGDTLDAVIAGVNLAEDDPLDDSVGYGGLPNEDCEVELDSCVMHGPTRRAGSVASLKHIKNPSQVARLVLERTDHLMIVGEGALRFALKHGFKREDLLTESSRKLWLKWREELNPQDNWGPSWHRTTKGKQISQTKVSKDELAFNLYAEERLRNRPTGTINCLAVDANGNLSGVTTTSGLAWKIPGRVGDSPLIGCGLYVDNEVGAAGSTGRGEECIYINGGHTIVENMRRGLSPTEAALDAIKRIAARYENNLDELRKFDINFYALNKKGEYGGATLWGLRDDGKRNSFALHDGKEARLIDCVALYQKK